MARTIDRIAADAETGALTKSAGSKLPDRFVGEGTATGNHADFAGFVDVTGHDADFALTGSDDAGAIRPNQADLLVAQADLGAHHVDNGNAFSDTNDELDARISGFEDRVGCAGSRDKNHRGVTAGLFACQRRMEDRDLLSHVSPPRPGVTLRQR